MSRIERLIGSYTSLKNRGQWFKSELEAERCPFGDKCYVALHSETRGHLVKIMLKSLPPLVVYGATNELSVEPSGLLSISVVLNSKATQLNLA